MEQSGSYNESHYTKYNHFVDWNGDNPTADLDAKIMSDLPLSAKEIEIIGLVVSGKGTREITEALLLSGGEVNYHLGNIISKLKANGAGKLVTLNQQTEPAKISRPKVVASIPCYNEERFISDIVHKVKKCVDQVIVIDDGSNDKTSEVAIAAGALVLRHENNIGAGAATRSSFEIAKLSDADLVVTIDGDNQHRPEEISELVAPILRCEADLVIGSRFLPQAAQRTNIPKYRKFGIDVITWLFNIGSKVKVSDSQSCFRAYSKKLIGALDITENRYGFSIEVLIQAREKGFNIKEVPISCLYHSESSTINPVKHGLCVALTVIKFRLKGILHTVIGNREKCGEY